MSREEIPDILPFVEPLLHVERDLLLQEFMQSCLPIICIEFMINMCLLLKLNVDHLYVANMGAGRVNHQTGLASAVIDNLSLTPAGAERMREVNNLEATDFVATLTHPLQEYSRGK